PVFALAYVVPAVAGLWALDADWRSSDFWWQPMAEERAAAQSEIALLRNAKGPAICEMLSLCYWAGKPASFDVFNMGQAYATGTRSDAALVKDIAARRYGIIQFEEMSPFPLTPRVRDALLEHYRLARQDDDRVFFVPRP